MRKDVALIYGRSKERILTMDSDDDYPTSSAPNQTPQSTSKKRTYDDDATDLDADDLLGQICSKLNTLTTVDTNENKIEAFTMVLACTKEEAIFFLESAQWSVEAAVGLWLENGQDNKRSRFAVPGLHTTLGGSFEYDPKAFDGQWGGPTPLSSDPSGGVWFGSVLAPGRYIAKPVVIEGLDPVWSAWVSRKSGHVYFRHDASGHTQREVPPGFADDVDFKSSSSSSNGGQARMGDGDNQRPRTRSHTDAGWTNDIGGGEGQMGGEATNVAADAGAEAGAETGADIDSMGLVPASSDGDNDHSMEVC